VTSNTRLVRIFVASPGDVEAERDALARTVKELDRTLGPVHNLSLRLLRWEEDTWPGFGRDGQDVINAEIGEYDIFVSVMWKRLGTPTPRAASGTVEEFDRAYSRWELHGLPKLMLYFNRQPIDPNELEQIEQVNAYKKAVRERGGLTWDYNGPVEFERFVREHLFKELSNSFAADAASSPGPPDPGVLGVPEFMHLVPRAASVEKLVGLFEESPLTAVEGLSGSGKTSIVADALRGSGLAESTLWIDTEQGATLDDVLGSVAARIGFESGSAPGKAKELVHHLVAGDARMVIDDFHAVAEGSFAPLIKAVSRVQPPARLILVSRRRVELDPAVNGPCRLVVEGLSASEIAAMLEARGVLSPPERWIAQLAGQVGGLPIAVTLFATAVTEFDRDGDDLLAGSLVVDARLRQWFDEIIGQVGLDSQRLLRFLSIADGPFNRSVVRLAGEREGVVDVDAGFEVLQRAHLVRRYSPSRWSVHQLIGAFASGELDRLRVAEIHVAYGDYYLRDVDDRSRQPMDPETFALTVSACRHLQMARRYGESQELLNRLARTTKARGQFETFLQLCRPELEVEGHDLWLDYHYAHCCLLTGRLCAAAEAVRTTSKLSVEPSLHLSLVRLHAESLEVAGHSQRALTLLLSATAAGATASDVTRAQAQALLSRIYLSIGNAEKAAEIASTMLKRARRVNNSLGIAIASAALGYARLSQDNAIAAEQCLSTAVELFVRKGDRRGASWALSGLARVALARGDSPAAAKVITAVIRARSDLTECSGEYLDFLSLARDARPTGADGAIDEELTRVGRLLEGERKAFLDGRLHVG
jgi:tetratricopeptide (TPR) repeat protein